MLYYIILYKKKESNMAKKCKLCQCLVVEHDFDEDFEECINCVPEDVWKEKKGEEKWK